MHLLCHFRTCFLERNNFSIYSAPNERRPRVALVSSGGIRTSLAAGPVTLQDLLTVFPFQNTWDLASLPGAAIRAALEHSVGGMSEQGGDGGGQFLHLAGLRVRYDLRQPPDQRVAAVLVRGPAGWSHLEGRHFLSLRGSHHFLSLSCLSLSSSSLRQCQYCSRTPRSTRW